MKSVLDILNGNRRNLSNSRSPEWIAGLLNDLSGAYNLATNPAGALKAMIQNNPKYQEYKQLPDDAQRYIDENGGDPEKAFRKFAMANGINPDSFIGIVQRFMR